MIVEVPQDATVEELISRVEAAFADGRGRSFRLACQCRLGGESVFADILQVAKDWGVTCVPGQRLRP